MTAVEDPARRAAPAGLTAANAAALEHVTTAARVRRAEALERIARHTDADVPAMLGLIREHGRVTLNFHPDRLLVNGLTVAESMALDGRYRSQYETGVTNGSRTAFLGGLRDGWERDLFAEAYHRDDVSPAERPKYGAFNLAGHADGASPRFGSCHVRLRPAMTSHCTFSFHDSHLGPADVGTLDAFECVLAGLLEEAAQSGSVLGLAGADAVAVLRGLPDRAVAASPAAANGRSLDDYIEAQVHGEIDLGAAAEAIVLDPSFRGTRTHEILDEVARTCGIALEWHGGFALAAHDVDEEFRGPQVPPLAKHVCALFGRQTFDAELVGRAAAAAIRTPQNWTAWGDQDEVLQLVKYLWHTLVAFGRPHER
ncbi:MAG: DUF3626 domain-containing protein [Hamadaea sp.]|nr:DUF3626 domain-containing protein [Hamadaea sp.]